MSYDFSHLYKTEVVRISPDFEVVIQEIPHGAVADLQTTMFSNLKFDNLSGSRKNNRQVVEQEMMKALTKGTLNPTEFQDRQNLLAVRSWTLKDARGEDVPVCLEAWKALPHSITEQIEKVIERVNPDLDDEFQSDT